MENSETSDAPNQSPTGVNNDGRLVNTLQLPSFSENRRETITLDERRHDHHHHLESLNGERLENLPSSTLLLQYKELVRQRDSELNELKEKLLLNENRNRQLTVENNNLKDEIVALRAAQKDEEMVIDEYHSSIDDSELQLNNSNDNIFNEDCLLEIFSYLSMEDMMQVEKVCKKWNQVSQQWFKRVQTLVLDVYMDGKFTMELYTKYYKRKIYEKTGIDSLCDLILILHSHGHHIKYYYAEDFNQGDQSDQYEKFIFQWMPKLCKNIEDVKIKIIHDDVLQPNFKAMATHWKKLKKITIENTCQIGDKNFLELLRNNKQLEIIELSCEYDSTDSMSCKFFTYLPTKVKEISIKNMSIDDTKQLNHFISASRNFTLLQSFELSMSSSCLTDAVVASIVNIKSLTHLSLCQNSFESCRTINSIANMKGLKALFLSCCSDLSEDSIIDILNGCTQLEQLDIWTEELTDEGMAAIAKLKKLKCLCIRMKNVTDESIIYSCDKLEALWFYHSKMNNSDATKLLKKLTNLRFVGFYNCETITKDILQAAEEIANERKNNTLYFSGCYKHVGNIDTPYFKYIKYSAFYDDLPMEKFPSDIRNYMKKQIEINNDE